ncbi:uncharacterized protein RSE6_15076 [Rhynchosporium secalis]|uniref:Amidase domain-containing protein n=1 Tax=Rhynchosporium secalis TaxID=38038 RepID=A0A1E1MWN2_RHYSE|nr:uncharacterized protein RSE6_15076 [Rhynchosporium secalis]
MYDNGPFTTVDIGPNIPFGITFIGRAYSEATIPRIAYAFEQLRLVREQIQLYKPPKTELAGFKNISPGHSKVQGNSDKE